MALDISAALPDLGDEALVVSLSEEVPLAKAYPSVEVRICSKPKTLRFLRGFSRGSSALQSVVDGFAPDVIHCHLFAAELLVMSLREFEGLWVSHLHDNMPQLKAAPFALSKKWLVEAYERYFVLSQYKRRNRHIFLSISQDTWSYFRSVLPIALHGRMQHMPNAVSLDRFSRKRPMDRRKLRICNVGSFQSKKNQTFLVDIGLELVKLIDFEVHFIGDGALRQDVEEKAKQSGLADQFIFHGNSSCVEDLLQSMNLYVHTAYYEPFGLVLLEAMAAALPVISLDGRGNADLLKDGVNGRLLPEQDALAFSTAILDVWGNDHLYSSFQRAGLETAQRFGMEAYVKRLKAVYLEALLQ